MADEQTQQPTSDTGATSTPAPASPKPSPAEQQDPRIYDDEGKRWSDKFWGAVGQSKQLASKQADMQATIDDLQSKLKHSDTAVIELKTQMGELGTQIATIPDLRQTIVEQTQTISALEKYQVLTEYPDLLKMKVDQETTDKDGETVTTQTNPFLQLVGSSSLGGDALRAELERLSRAFSGWGATPKKDPTVMTPAVPAQGEPAVADAESAYARVLAVQEQMNTGDTSPAVTKEYVEAWDAYNKATASDNK